MTDYRTVLALMSGGLDSTTLVSHLQVQGYHVQGIHFTYGSNHEDAETRALNAVAKRLKVQLHSIDISELDLFKGGKSSLMGQAPVPAEEYQEVEHEGPSNTVVPFRNGVMISMAVAKANSLGLDTVAVGVHANDHSHWAYPDCSPEFMGPMTGAVYAGTFHEVRLITPFIWFTKSDLVTIAQMIHAPLEATYSCYNGREVSCGVCPTCQERIAAFKQAGLIDPIDYEISVDWGDCSPWQLAMF